MTEKQLRDLFDRSEGWAVGLQLVALYLSKLPDNGNQLMESIGSLKDIADYLAREVLDQQPESIIEFLMKTSILQRFSAPVCDALVGQNNSLEALKMLEESNLFIVPLDENREWYRYHHFFQNFLQTQLHQTHPTEISVLYRNASKWFQDNEMFHEAVEYALEGKEYALASELIEQHTIAEFIRGRMPQVNQWISRIPENVREQQPRLLLMQGTALYHMNQSESARLISRKLKKWLKHEGHSLPKGQLKRLKVERKNS